jgi:hypothetical protein
MAMGILTMSLAFNPKTRGRLLGYAIAIGKNLISSDTASLCQASAMFRPGADELGSLLRKVVTLLRELDWTNCGFMM